MTIEIDDIPYEEEQINTIAGYCPKCTPLASRILALEQELAAYKSVVDGNINEQVVRLLCSELEITPRQSQLITMLWLLGDRPISRDFLADNLWPDSDQARENLKVTAWKINRDFEPFVPLIMENGTIQLSPDMRSRVTRLIPPSMLPGR